MILVSSATLSLVIDDMLFSDLLTEFHQVAGHTCATTSEDTCHETCHHPCQHLQSPFQIPCCVLLQEVKAATWSVMSYHIWRHRVKLFEFRPVSRATSDVEHKVSCILPILDLAPLYTLPLT